MNNFNKVVTDKYQIVALENPLLRTLNLSGLSQAFIKSLRNLDYILHHDAEGELNPQDISTARRLVVKKLWEGLNGTNPRLPNLTPEEVPEGMQRSFKFVDRLKKAIWKVIHDGHQEKVKNKQEDSQRFAAFLNSLKQTVEV